MSTLLIKNARYIVSCDDTDRLYERSNLFIRDNAIEYIGPELRQADQVIDASRMVVYPGLINTHHHLYQLFSRNLPEVQRMELFPWLVTLYDVWKNLDEEVVATSSLVGMAELLKTGCTTCFDHHYVFPARAGDLIGAQFRAAELVGMRFHASRGSMDLSRKDGGLPPDSVVQTIDQILADSERLVRVWHDPSRFSMRQVALAPAPPSPCPPTCCGRVRAWPAPWRYGCTPTWRRPGTRSSTPWSGSACAPLPTWRGWAGPAPTCGMPMASTSTMTS